MRQSSNKQEWVYNFDVQEVGTKPVLLTLVPTEQERKMLSKRFGIVGIDDAKAELTIRRNPDNRVIYISGHLKAHIRQKCIVTLDSVAESIDETFEGWFADLSQAVSFSKEKRERMSLKEKEEQPILDESEDPEPIVDGKIDLGEFVSQYFSLAINPYPRSEKAIKTQDSCNMENMKGGSKEDPYTNPFAVLKDWKIKERKNEH